MSSSKSRKISKEELPAALEKIATEFENFSSKIDSKDFNSVIFKKIEKHCETISKVLNTLSDLIEEKEEEINMSRLSSEKKTKDNNPYTLAELKGFAKMMGLEKYSKMDKVELVNLIRSHMGKSKKVERKTSVARTPPKIDMKRLTAERKTKDNNPYTLAELKEFAKDLALEKYTKMDKAELVEAIRAAMDNQSNSENESESESESESETESEEEEEEEE